MPALVLSDIIARFRTVLEAAPVSLTETREAFSHERQPNAALENSYYLEDGGIVSSRSVSNYDVVRLDRLTVFIAKKLAFDGATAMDALEDTLVSVERALVADGTSQGYNVNVEQRRMTRPAGRDYCVGSLAVTVDYDYREIAS
jgi:hypothetical protein